ncbi:hypothetical protein A3I34_00680 [Candidatus Jorgensenbacteria bacterium RIFCSPLOWO2_02_FULL_45_12]|uniref:Uncharacterized protein n=1 Tax=Candidatus Jorgensenbacteria bacterium RIFCSPHIGHO2_02_FULL_45_20 TaxID=1798470 RepID=A0A1F6BPP9_9BACT|nr:MAG: hypothetical protein A3D55_02415 [Candidatus Jorgensenbacteria bacterium RIFCSPHIGHO2_02_FULL_45_20]OGG42498.1 MAG: hypothetical protein A3I34_00680 [Candidatus Jorgensenbacteria bacterium RIFCSPLOWO2_02_FULL_45_12]
MPSPQSALLLNLSYFEEIKKRSNTSIKTLFLLQVTAPRELKLLLRKRSILELVRTHFSEKIPPRIRQPAD